MSVPLRARSEANVDRSDLSVMERLSRLSGMPAR